MRTLNVHIGTLLVLLGAGLSTGCNQANEGDRCNPARTANDSDECGSGLSCQQPTNCPENYCCPTSGPSSNPYCQTGCNGGDSAICAGEFAAGSTLDSFCQKICDAETKAKVSLDAFCSTPAPPPTVDAGKDGH